MGYTLIIDSGNTACKAYLFSGDDIVATMRYTTPSIENLVEFIDGYDIIGVIYCTVARYDAKLVESLRHTVNANVIVLTHDTLLPIKIDYKTPKTLGYDRVAAAIGASELVEGKSILVVDAGTALTIDVVDEKGVYKGGNISPGISLRFKSLNDYTQLLPLIDNFETFDVPLFGHDTPSAIIAGVVNGVVAEVEIAYQNAHKRYGDTVLVLTGGDARYLSTRLNLNIESIIISDDLVAKGLNRILRYNENI